MLVCALIPTMWLTVALAADQSPGDLQQQVRDAERAFAKTMADRDHNAFVSFLLAGDQHRPGVRPAAKTRRHVYIHVAARSGRQVAHHPRQRLPAVRLPVSTSSVEP